ncbi:MAG: hypothetical protein OXK16_12735 [bacterium]|nr:hypothetical protein [bacterium]
MAADSRDSLLAHLAGKFTGQTETLATEALGYILSRSGAAREALREMLQDGGADVGALKEVATEVIGEQGERVDLVASDEKGSERVLIEVKFWAGLTDNQPSTYLKRLPTDGDPAVLLFVAPEQRLVTLWVEICGRAREARWDLETDAGTEELKSVTVGGGPRRLMLTSWRTLLAAMSYRAGKGSDSAAERDIQQLAALCERQDRDAFLPLRSDELAPAFPRRMLDMERLWKDATARAVERGRELGRPFVNTDGTAVAPQWHGSGRHIQIGKEDAWWGAWFGVHYELWVRERETPLWLTFWDDHAPAAEKKLGSQNCGFTLPVDVEYGRVLDSVVEELQKIAHTLSS